MARIQNRSILKIEILFIFVLMLSFSFGCKTAPKQPPAVKKGILDDVLVFRDLQQVDLDNDGIKDVVAIYATVDNLTGVKTIISRDGKGEVAFEDVFNTADVKFAMKDNKPALIVEQKDKAAGCTDGRVKRIYYWDGKTFKLAGKQ